MSYSGRGRERKRERDTHRETDRQRFVWTLFYNGLYAQQLLQISVVNCYGLIFS